MRAPILDSGLITLPIGLCISEASPTSSQSKFWPAKIPANSRMPVPAFPKSIASCGAIRPCNPTPLISRLPASGPSIVTPICRKAAIVLRASSPSRKPVTSVIPSAKEPSITDRCDIDLSPGTRCSPVSWPPGCTTNLIQHPVLYRSDQIRVTAHPHLF